MALARALVRQPVVLLMDEPLSAIDAKVRVQLRTEIKQLHQETGITTIYVTHDQEEAMTLGDKIVVMDGGKIQQIGSPHQIFHKPINLFVATFVGNPSMNIIQGNLSRNGDGHLILDAQGFKQPIPDRYIDTFNKNSIDSVLWGIRPEHIRLTESATGYAIPARINVVEPLGSRDLLNLQIGSFTIQALVEAAKEDTHVVGNTCCLNFPEEHVILFNPQYGNAI